MKKIVFIAKGNLNTDGRILNQIKILENHFPKTSIDFILLPDEPVRIDPGKNVTIHIVETTFRHKRFLRGFTALEFFFKSLYLLLKLRPGILHAHDSTVVQPVLFYRFIKGSKFRLIYDDHEIPNENGGIFDKIFNCLEVILMKRADCVIFANNERAEIIVKRHSLKTSCSYFLNLPYFENESPLNMENDDQLKLIDKEISLGVNFIIHQGPIARERGRKKLADFVKVLPSHYKILLLGGSFSDYEAFLNEFQLDKTKFFFRGTVNYLVLPEYWNRGVASVVMYLPTYLNNRFCAPNRFYISLQKSLPVIVNKGNPVLSNFIKKYSCGFFIENLDENNLDSSIEKLRIPVDVFKNLKQEQIHDFVSIYQY